VIILDTDVLSAIMHPRPDPIVVSWMNRQTPASLWTTVVTVFEVQRGIAMMTQGARRLGLESQFSQTLTKVLDNRVLKLDYHAAEVAGELSAQRSLRGLNIGITDTLIAGIAIANLGRVATRNERHFADVALYVINPWSQ
jgi:predicted nucleic acid-binding protein